MVYGAINEKGEKLYTYLPKLFDSIDNAQLNYNWLITDCFCNIDTPVTQEERENGYCWISGEDLTKLVQEKNIQWIFAVLSGFPKDVPLSEILKYPLPYADGYGGFWHNPISMQHPLATMEIVPWDSTLTLFFSTEKELVHKFMAGYPQSEDLAAYIARYEKPAMQRILIIGNAGSGKTTFAKQLAKKLCLPLIHLDKLFWQGEWTHLSRNEFDAALQAELEKPEWIIDGNFNRTIPHRLQYCDTVFFFDLPTVACLAGITKRVLANYGKTRDDMGGHCIERFDSQKLDLYRNVLTFNKQHRKDYYALLEKASHAQVIIFRNRREARKFIKRMR